MWDGNGTRVDFAAVTGSSWGGEGVGELLGLVWSPASLLVYCLSIVLVVYSG